MTEQPNQIALFRGKEIRRIIRDNEWCFSVVDIVAVLTDSKNPAVYWRVLKKRLLDEGSDQTVTKCNALKMPAADGKMRLTDVADTETMLRIIQSIPSPRAEPFKRWLAKVGKQRKINSANTEGLFRIIQSIPSPKAELLGIDNCMLCSKIHSNRSK